MGKYINYDTMLAYLDDKIDWYKDLIHKAIEHNDFDCAIDYKTKQYAIYDVKKAIISMDVPNLVGHYIEEDEE